jgi:hypothetical protein
MSALSYFRGIAGAVALTASLAGFAARAEETKVPTTAADHLQMAKTADEKAAAWRKEAAVHQEMAAAYARAYPPSKSGVPNVEAVKMEKHCMAIVRDAEKAAADADWISRYHRQRALELEGR